MAVSNIGLVDFHLYLNNSKIVRTLRDDGIKDMIKKSWQRYYHLPLVIKTLSSVIIRHSNIQYQIAGTKEARYYI